MDIPIKITTQDKLLVFEMFEVKQTKQGMQKEISAGATLRWDSTYIREAFGVPDIISLTLQFGRDVAVGLFSAWLYDKLKGRSAKLEIGNQQVPIDKEAIEERLKVLYS